MRNTLPETIREAIECHTLIPDGAKVVAGVSGGADSVALLRALHQLGISCTVAHLNHQLRGDASDADERFVRELAGELGLPIVVGATDVKHLAESSHLSVEMAARRARHDFFAEFRDSVVALAHHADDQVETFILKLARGAGTEGLGGMPFSQKIGQIRLIRPMLNIPRTEILGWLQENGFGWREDASNADETFLRNKVRHTILPLLEKELNPNIRATILRTMDILRQEDGWMDSIIADETRQERYFPAENYLRFASGRLPIAGSHVAARRRGIRKWLFDQGVEEVGFDAVEKILKQMDAAEGTTTFELNNRQRVVVEYGIPRFENVGQASPPGAGRQGCLPRFRLTTEGGSGWRKDHGRGAGILPAEASFSAEKVGDSPIEVRGWKPGDRIAPLGMDGHRKLQDIFTDQKIPLAQRPRIPVVVCRGEVIWVPGYRTARGWEVEGKNGKAIHARVE